MVLRRAVLPLLSASLLGTLLPLSAGFCSNTAPPDPNASPTESQPAEPAEPEIPRYIVVSFPRNLVPTDINNHGEILFSNGAIGQVLTDGVTATVVPVSGPSSGNRRACALNDRRDMLLWGPDGVFLRTANNETACLFSLQVASRLPLPPPAATYSINNNRQSLIRVMLPHSDVLPNTLFMHCFLGDPGQMQEIDGKFVFTEAVGVSDSVNRTTAQNNPAEPTLVSAAAPQVPNRPQRQKSATLSPRDANDAGHIAGFLMNGNAADDRAGFWDGKQVRRLQPLLSSTHSYAFGLNNADELVGYCGGPRGEKATLWLSPGQAPIDLNLCLPEGSGVRLGRANRINDAGYIIGEGGGGGSLNWLLVPVPKMLEQ